MKVEYDPLNNAATVFPDGPLSKADFEDAAAQIDPAIEKHGLLNGLVIAMDSFPGWESFGSLVSHLRFVHDHHKAVARVALVTDSALGLWLKSGPAILWPQRFASLLPVTGQRPRRGSWKNRRF